VDGQDVFGIDKNNLTTSEDEALAVLQWDQDPLDYNILPKVRFEIVH
jgi:hypothetical protein